MRKFMNSLGAGGSVIPSTVKIGFFSDLHHCPPEPNQTSEFPASSKYYQQAVEKLTDAITAFNSLPLDFVVANGDLTDALGTYSEAQQTTWMNDIDTLLQTLNAPYKVTLGNHEMNALSKTQVIAGYTGFEATYYYYDLGNYRFIFLDACYYDDDDDAHYDDNNWRDADGGLIDPDENYIPPVERAWLQSLLNNSGDKKIIVFCHHPLFDDQEGYGWSVTNDDAVRAILETNTNVLAVISGHEHKNRYFRINGIDYYGMAAITQYAYPAVNYSIIEITGSNIVINGYGSQTSYPDI